MEYGRGPRDPDPDYDDQVAALSGYGRADADQVRSIHIRLKPGDYRELVRRARLADVRPWDLVITWVEEHLRRPDVSSEIDELKDLLLEYREAANKAFVRMERLERAAGDIFGILGPPPQARPELARRATRPAATVPARGGSPARTRRNGKPSLHQEIAAVLRAAGGPLSAGDIAREVDTRGLYKGRGGPITTTIVNSRVSHPMYRQYFTRANGVIGLADEAASGL
jgi:hypothetical protein